MSGSVPDVPPAPAAGLVLAGGAGRRLGGVDKPGLTVAGRTLLAGVLAALADVPVVVVGPGRPVCRPVRFVVEDPPGGGPAAAVAAGVAALVVPDGALVALLAADLPAVSADTLHRLAAAVSTGVDGAVLMDGGREQILLSVWRHGSLAAACAVRSSWAGESLRSLLAPLTRVPVPAAGSEAADIDTPEQWERWSQG